MSAKKRRGPSAPVWRAYMNAAWSRLAKDRQNQTASSDADFYKIVGEEIVRAGEGEKFLKAVRRGRATQRQNARYQIMRVVEAAIGAGVPRRRDDRNTPEATTGRVTLELQG